MQNSEAESLNFLLVGSCRFLTLCKGSMGVQSMVTRENLSCLSSFDLGSSGGYGIKCAVQIQALPKKGGGRGRGRANIFQDLHIGFFLDLVTNFLMNFVTNFVIAKFGDKSKSSESRKTVP